MTKTPYSEQREAQTTVDELTLRMIEFDKGDAKRIQHFLKVHRFAQFIGRAEHLEPHALFVLECAAVLHDIGIHPAEAKYGNCNGKLQEQEGPVQARYMLERMRFDTADIDRICWLIAHHHTYTDIKDLDYQILVEADFLVNAYEDNLSEHAVLAMMKNIFRTETGRKLGKLMFLEKYDPSQQPDAATM
ncbi:MAG: HD domain-containing protein [Bacteroidales bacterium]|nr:HD domain-containing protein [Prevotella sp.]MDY6270841.1 HD domain-containing protein [Prevotella sp.]MDY6347397.1 HD domain-containing protein [Bacteroidales bacterium]